MDDEHEMFFERKELIRQTERLIISTGPWQGWLMRVRHIYLWEDPWLTARWLALYLFLIKTNYVMTFCVSSAYPLKSHAESYLVRLGCIHRDLE